MFIPQKSQQFAGRTIVLHFITKTKTGFLPKRNFSQKNLVMYFWGMAVANIEEEYDLNLKNH